MPADVGKLPRELGGGAVLPAMDDRSCVLLLRGERLLMVKGDDLAATPPPISVVVNWFEELNARVPIR